MKETDKPGIKMAYTLILAIFSVLGSYLLIHSYSTLFEKKTTQESVEWFRRMWAYSALYCFIPVILLASPIFLTVSDFPWRKTLGFDAVWLVAAACIYLLALVVFMMAENKRNSGRLAFWKKIWLVCSLSAVAVCGMSAYKHLTFANEELGVLSFNYVRDLVPDVQCNASVILLQWKEGSKDPITWRCPTKVIFMINSGSPFIPWPGIREGTSSELPKVLNTMFEQARNKAQ